MVHCDADVSTLRTMAACVHERFPTVRVQLIEGCVKAPSRLHPHFIKAVRYNTGHARFLNVWSIYHLWSLTQVTARATQDGPPVRSWREARRDIGSQARELGSHAGLHTCSMVLVGLVIASPKSALRALRPDHTARHCALRSCLPSPAPPIPPSLPSCLPSTDRPSVRLLIRAVRDRPVHGRRHAPARTNRCVRFASAPPAAAASQRTTLRRGARAPASSCLRSLHPRRPRRPERVFARTLTPSPVSCHFFLAHPLSLVLSPSSSPALSRGAPGSLQPACLRSTSQT
jgi:hypothetical protein